MRRIVDIIPARQAIEGDAADSVRLDHDLRNRRRMVFTTVAGDSVLLDMPRPVHLRGGDRLQLEDGALIRVEAMDEALTEISASSTAALVRIAWHLGNRHLPTQLMPGDTGGTLRIRHDHVIEDMVAGLGGTYTLLMAPFDPEGGAYAGEEGDAAPLSGHHHHHHDHAHG
jgi:urease accessory protein